MSRTKFAVLMHLLLAVSLYGATIITIPVDRDVHVATYAPATNLNGGDYLKVQHGYESSFVLASTLTTVLAGYAADDITQAKYVFYASSLKVHSVTSVAVLTPWQDSTLVYNDVASMSFDWSTQTSVSFGTNYTAFSGWVQMDVTDAVKKWVSGANPNYGLTLYAGYPDTDVYIITQENQWGAQYGSYFEIQVGTDAELSLDTAISGNPFSRYLFGQVLPFKSVSRMPSLTWVRGPNISGSFYNWKKPLLSWNPLTALEAYRICRDKGGALLHNVNTIGNYGILLSDPQQTPTHPLTPAQRSVLATYAAENVRYANYILQTYRQGDTLPAAEQAILNSLDWGSKPKLLAVGEAATPRIQYWEIGNEPDIEADYSDYPTIYKEVTAAMLAQDSTIKVGPSSARTVNDPNWSTNPVRSVLVDPTATVHFLSIHCYESLGLLYNQGLANSANIPNMELGLTELNKPSPTLLQGLFGGYIDSVRSFLNANGRSSAEIIMSEYEPTGWQPEYEPSKSTMYNALAVAEAIFVMMQKGVKAANLWYGVEAYGFDAEVPSAKVLKEMIANAGDRLIYSYANDTLKVRIYITKDSSSGKTTIWALNFNNSTTRKIQLSLSNFSLQPNKRAIRKVLRSTVGTTNFFSQIGFYQGNLIDWVATDMTASFIPTNVVLTLPAATITAVILNAPCGEAGTGYLDGDLNSDCRVNLADFAEFSRWWLECNIPGGSGCIQNW